MAWSQDPIQSEILSQADIWDRVEHPAQAAKVPEPLPEAGPDQAVPDREEAAAEGKKTRAHCMGRRQDTTDACPASRRSSVAEAYEFIDRARARKNHTGHCQLTRLHHGRIR